MPPLSRSDLEAVLAPLDVARPLPARAYLDEEVLRAERRALFDRSWLLVGREDEVREPGSWMRTPFERLVVMRGEDLELRAFFDVCRHRASTLLDGEAGRCVRLVCPYHGWTYDLAGRLRVAPDVPSSFDRAAHGLVRAAVDTFQGFVFVNRDPAARPLREALSNVPPWLERLPSLRLARRTTSDVAANWKLLVENFQEAHHFPRVHPGLEALTPARDSSSRIGDGPWLSGTMELATETVSDDGLRHGRPFVAGPQHRARVHDALFFPSLLTSLQPDYLLTYRLFPIDAQHTRVTADVLVHAAAEGPFDAVFSFWDRTNAEDRAICERQQQGLRSGAWTPSCYARVEDGTHAFDRLVARALLAEDA